MRGSLLHHDPSAAEGVEGIRHFLGLDWVHQFSVVFHTLGALLVVGALAAVLYLRTLGADASSPVWLSPALRRVRSILFVGWGLNFLGGIMRLYEPDHPGITQAGDSAWVQILLAKHIALLGAIVFSLLAVDIGPKLWRRPNRLHALIALVLVLFATLAGGVSTGVSLGTADNTAGNDANAMEDHAGHVTFRYQNATYQMTGTLLTPGSNRMTLVVPENASEVLVQLSWTMEQSDIRAELYDPDGKAVAESGSVTATTAEMSVAKDIMAGTWSVVVIADRAVQESVGVTTRIAEGGKVIRVLEEIVTLQGLGFEVNLYMDPGDWFTYDWSLGEGDPAVPWDIHSHPGGEVVTHVSGTDTAANGNFTAGPDEVYSIFWRLPENLAAGEEITLTYRLEGPFRIHSIFRGT